MAAKKAFPLRIDPDLYEAIRLWAEDDLRSVNGQIEFLLSRALREAGRKPRPAPSGAGGSPPPSAAPDAPDEGEHGKGRQRSQPGRDPGPE